MPHSSPSPALHFCYADELHAKLLHLLDALEQADDPTRPDTGGRWAIWWWN